jgi:hypothetical protein
MARSKLLPLVVRTGRLMVGDEGNVVGGLLDIYLLVIDTSVLRQYRIRKVCLSVCARDYVVDLVAILKV